MAQFDVYRNPNPDTRDTIPYLLDVQADILANLSTRVVVPLITAPAFGRPAKLLNPALNVEGTTVYMSTAELAGVSVRTVGDKVASLGESREAIIAALDFLFTGF